MSNSDQPQRLVVGKREMAELLGVASGTPAKWVERARLPEPDHPPVNGQPTWTVNCVLQWAERTGRMRGSMRV